MVVRPATGGGEQTILYLAASPRGLEPLRSDREMRKVKERLQLSRQRDRFRIESCLAARFVDVSQALVDYEPQVVHFSGHGDRHGRLCFEDESGKLDLIAPEGLADLFGQHRSALRCVILNACFSTHLAETVAAQIDHVVGMRYPIGDAAAIEFSVGFYLGLFGGLPVPEAFARGRAHLRARPQLAPQHQTPLLFSADPQPTTGSAPQPPPPPVDRAGTAARAGSKAPDAAAAQAKLLDQLLAVPGMAEPDLRQQVYHGLPGDVAHQLARSSNARLELVGLLRTFRDYRHLEPWDALLASLDLLRPGHPAVRELRATLLELGLASG